MAKTLYLRDTPTTCNLSESLNSFQILKISTDFILLFRFKLNNLF